jgi:membrane associated rhomboid family serine protease
MPSVSTVIAWTSIAVGAITAIYYLLALSLGRAPLKPAPVNRRLMSRNLGFSLFVAFEGLFQLAGGGLPASVRWSVSALATVILAVYVVWLIRTRHSAPA